MKTRLSRKWYACSSALHDGVIAQRHISSAPMKHLARKSLHHYPRGIALAARMVRLGA